MNELQHDVPRETLERLHVFEDLVIKWTPTINLVSRESSKVLWDRHVLDSLQMFRAAPPNFASWADIGSGGGFPGIVVAILAGDLPRAPKITLVESDARKCAFLRTALRETGSVAEVINDRIELAEPLETDVLSARALANLNTLLGFAERHLSASGTALFAKGARWQEEVVAAKSKWRFDYDVVKSELEADAAILRITGVSRV
ncbi:16S rRNA (guanine(527)-N(7))-methyltransferase RsmG [Roseovarius sp. Pro17]|uniref:16S rRNA (guanine(527)-N(7))-methyltransferase RsmG n=1 Tax=Roseovarius sp. Pro17 TaxID=3108175 RepID=UPI002D766584|nr:16S rRNA (guanine(527)-N(7))-methyltransferase RsmG [Roseovarius sp. Pro17]